MQSKLFLKMAGLLTCLYLMGCSATTVEEIDLEFGYDYFPLEVGKYRVYQVDSVIYDPILRGTRADSSTTFIRDFVVDSFLDNTGQTRYRVERAERKSASQPWNIEKTVQLYLDDNRAFWVEDNLPFIKMVFPLKPGRRWNGNVFFDPTVEIPVAGESVQIYKDWSYEILEIGEAAELGDLSFSEVATVQLADSENLIELRRALEQYARGVGLIYREYNILNTQCEVCCDSDFSSCEPLPWTEKAEKGFVIKQRLIEFN